MGDTAKTLCLFDVDGTLTRSRQRISNDMDAFLAKLKKKAQVGLVSGSDIGKIEEQMGSHGLNIIDAYNYVFAENGLVAFVHGIKQPTESILNHLGEEKLQTFINFCLEYLSKLVLPCKRGTFIELRTGMINICPVGRSCNQKERDEFAAFDAINGVRSKLVEALTEKFCTDYDLTIAIGGQISIDVYPAGWNKTYCLRHLEEFDKILFFGDKTGPGGNDYEIFNHVRTIGYTVKNPEHTKEIVSSMFPDLLD